MDAAKKIVHISLDEGRVIRRSADVEHERAVAIYDLLDDNLFAVAEAPGPYHLYLSVVENRLMFDVRDTAEKPLCHFALAVTPFRSIIKDYFQVCETYFSAIKTQSPSRIEAIDMGRRALHSDGATLLEQLLKDKVEVDHQTARRLFTLVCVLHIRG